MINKKLTPGQERTQKAKLKAEEKRRKKKKEKKIWIGDLCGIPHGKEQENYRKKIQGLLAQRALNEQLKKIFNE